GHTDDTGEDAANLQLSQDRAAAVAAYLTKTKGIAANRITAKGYGETKPLKPNDSEPNKAENRRTEFRIIKQ
ncbi:MAG: OmpA family protein, partial [Bacteroidota bacterium]